jgi:predicted phosphodiesterase
MIKTRFLLLSDTHGRAPLPSTNKKFAFRHPLPSADVLLHAGDLTELGKQSEHQITFDMVKAINAELKVVIAGNHDLTLDEEFWDEFTSEERLNCEKAKELWTGEEARNAGIVYLEEGMRTFRLKSGAVFTVSSSGRSLRFHWAFRGHYIICM